MTRLAHATKWFILLLLCCIGAAHAQINATPGWTQVELEPLTPSQSEAYIASRVLPPDLNQPDTVMEKAVTARAADLPQAPGSLDELARALRNDPDLIYEFVRNNFEYYPGWGVQKGALGAVLDKTGTAFDQAALMVELLRRSGYTAGYVMGVISLPLAEAQAWLGSGDVCALIRLLSSGGVPVSPTLNECVGATTILLSHVWVKVNIGGTDYHFDPSYKLHTVKPAINIASAAGYDLNAFLSAARAGATITADAITYANRGNVRTYLTTYANNLATYLRTQMPTATLDDVIGGKTIVPHVGAPVRQTYLPYRHNSYALTEWATSIPAEYKAALQIRCSGIDRTFTAEELRGKRLSLSFDEAHRPILRLDGTIQQPLGNPVNQGVLVDVILKTLHPYSMSVPLEFTQKVKEGGTYVIVNGWGPVGRGSVEHLRNILVSARASGAADSSEAVLGASLAVLGETWLAEVDQTTYIVDRIARVNTKSHRKIGIAGYNGSTAYVDFPGIITSTTSETGNTQDNGTAFYSSLMHSSVLESVAVQQINNVSAVSTVKLIDQAVNLGYPIFDYQSSNRATIEPLLVGCGGWLSRFQGAASSGHRLILPSHCDLTENSWTGVGYFDIVTTPSLGMGAIIGQSSSSPLYGGFGTTGISWTNLNAYTATNSASTDVLSPSSGLALAEPIDLVKGHYLYAREDLIVGEGEFPRSLSLNRLYTSSAWHDANSLLGRGWTHNLASRVRIGSDGFQGMGEDSALDAVGSIVEHLVAYDLLSDPAKPLDKMVIATLGIRWFGDQLIGNTVIAQQGLNGEVFVKLPDGSYNAPPGSAAKLVKNLDNTHTYVPLHKARLNYDSDGKIASYEHPSGVKANFTYSGNNLIQVQNSLGRSLTLTYINNRLYQVSDGSRNVRYAYDGSDNLTTFTDTASQNTVFQYDQPGWLSRVYYPSTPAIPFVANVYDSLGRIRTQANANGHLYTYYFAGSRTEEVAPNGTSTIFYLNGLGKVIKAIDAVGNATATTYDGQSRPTKTTLPEGNAIEYEYDDAPCLTQKRCTHNVKTIRRIPKTGSPLPTLTSNFTYETTFNRLASATDPRGQITQYTYTAQGQPSQITGPADLNGQQPITTFGYTSYGATFYLPTSVTRKINTTESVVTSTSYNAANKYVPQQTVVDAGSGRLNLTTAFLYDSIGNLTQVNGPRTDVADITTFDYDSERRLIQTTNTLGKQTRVGYDADGHPVRVAAQIGSQWRVACKTYSPSGKPTRVWGPALTNAAADCPSPAAPVAVVDLAYDTQDRPIRSTQRLPANAGGDRVTETDYTPDGRVQAIRRAVGTPLEQTTLATVYTANGLPATLTDARGYLTTREYDGHDRLSRLRYPDLATLGQSSTADYEEYGYDANGNVVSFKKRDGQSLTLAYDNLNRLTSRSYPNAADNVGFTYDLLNRKTAANSANGHAVGYQWDAAGRLASTTMGGKIVTYQYDAAGNRTRLTWPEGFFVTTEYDALNRPTALKELGSTLLASPAWDDLSRRTQLTRANNTFTTHGYDTQGHLASLAHDLAGSADDIAYGYTRNPAGEIVRLAANNPAYAWSGTATGQRPWQANGLDQYTLAGNASPSWDANGNLQTDGAWTYAHDLDNRLTTASMGGFAASLAHDAEGRLRQTAINGVVTNLLHDGPFLIAEYDGAGNPTKRYVPGPGIDEPLVQLDIANGAIAARSWFHADHLGSIVAQSNGTGTATAKHAYGPYGEPGTAPGQSLPGRFGYTGQQYLAGLNLYHYKARTYSPSLGRFIETDPLGMPDGTNRYAYVGNNPINNVDPTGEFIPLSAAGVIWGGISGGIAGGISGWMTAGANAGFWSSVKSASIGAAVGGAVGAASGAAMQPQIASVLAVQAVSGVLGSAVSNPATTAITQAINNQPIQPMEQFTMQNLTPGFVGSVAGPAAVATARVGAALVNATLAGVQSMTGVGGPMIALESNFFGRTTDMLNGIVSGVISGSLAHGK